MKVLFAASELFPLIKTGGLGDVAHSLPNALAEVGAEVRIVLPAYRRVLQQLDALRVLGWLTLSGGREVRILEAHHAESSVPLWLVDAPAAFDRPGLPYSDAHGGDWPDNPQRFALLSEAAARLAEDGLDLGWRADVAHANDWQTGLLPAYLAGLPDRPRSLFTIHNLAYDCQFDYGTFQALHLPGHWWSMDHGEFHGRFSMLKAGIVCSDLVTTVSPRYAREIRTPEFGYGYADILETRAGQLVGILNGIDDSTWDPRSDPLLAAHYHLGGKIRSGKRANREALLEMLGGPALATQGAGGAEGPLIGSVGRLVYQKGIDLLLDAIPGLLADCDARFVVVGAGEPHLEERLRRLAAAHPGRVLCHIGYSERLAHLVEAGCDMFVMPSRYEPCGLNQMYSLRYGTPPVVRETGGLADTVVDADPRSIARGEANGFVFSEADSDALAATVRRACELFATPKQWMKLVKTGMAGDYGWRRSAAAYLDLYRAE
jgi:starch synthase